MKSLKSFFDLGHRGSGRLGLLYYLALSRGEQVSAIWMVTAAISVYCIAYRFYSLYIANRVMQLDPNRRLRQNATMTAWTMFLHIKAYCSATTLPLLPAQALWLVLYWQRKWVICPVLCGLFSAWYLPVPYRI